MKKIISSLIACAIFVPLVLAEDCGITNLATCIPQKFFEFLLNIMNAPLQPLLTLIKNLLTEPVDISLFASLWGLMVYILSMFYGLLLLYSGLKFIISGHDVVQRENAKEWFRNIFIMIVLVQASYFLYGVIVELGSLLSSGIVSMIDTDFFLLTTDNFINFGLQFIFLLCYLITLLLTSLLLTLRYIIVAGGVIFAPIGVFLYFIPPLKEYGKLIMNFLGMCIFITFFDAIVLLICSRIITIGVFSNFKILVMITAFFLVNLLLFYFLFFAAIKSAFKLSSETRSIISKIG